MLVNCTHCGKKFDLKVKNHYSNHFCSKSCENIFRSKAKRNNIIGKKYGRLTVLEWVYSKKKPNGSGNYNYYLCKCDCGKTKLVQKYDLMSGGTLSCGCLSREISSKNGQKRKKHGLTKSRIYGIWANIKDRCNNRKCRDYKGYGGRGVKICNDWQNNFMNFYNWSINNGYSDDLTIDRINVNGNYEPNNCRWVTMKEQANNRRNNKFITFNNETHTLYEWARITGNSPQKIRYRLNHNMTIEQALWHKGSYKNNEKRLSRKNTTQNT